VLFYADINLNSETAMNKGYLITFEGPEGSGKSTQIELLRARLFAAGREVVLTREPGGTPLAEEFRSILKHHTGPEELHPVTELLLFEAGRVQNVHCVIKPALAAGKVVLCDRFTDSTIAYQGYARGLDIAGLRLLNSLALDGVKIDLTVLLDLPPEDGFARTSCRESTCRTFDRLESAGIDFHHAVRRGFLEQAAAEPERFRVFNAAQDRDDLADAIYREVSRVV